jgi:hypothetical protein
LVEELGGWKYALRLLKYLKIGFDREKFLKIASFYFSTYLLSNSDCLDQNCPKLSSILSNKLTMEALLLKPEEQKRVLEYFNNIAKTIQLPDLGKIFND